jgi:hypothetical protein
MRVRMSTPPACHVATVTPVTKPAAGEASEGGQQAEDARGIGPARLSGWLLVLLVPMVLIAVAYARLPAADLGVGDALVGLALVAGAAVVMVVLFVVGLRTVPRASRPLLWTISMLLLLLEVFILLFAYAYLSLEVGSPGSVPGIVTHLDAVYFVVTMLATVGFGDIVPKSELARAVATFQMLFNLVLLGAVVRLGVEVGRHAAQQRANRGEGAADPGRLRREVDEWETGEDVGTPDREGTS